MALEDQPPWRKGNPERIRLLRMQHSNEEQYATTFQRRGARVVISTWRGW